MAAVGAAIEHQAVAVTAAPRDIAFGEARAEERHRLEQLLGRFGTVGGLEAGYVLDDVLPGEALGAGFAHRPVEATPAMSTR